MRLIIYQDFLRVGGTERQSVALAAAAARGGCEVMLLTNRPGGIHSPKLANLIRRSLQPIDTGIDEWAPNLETVVKEFRPDVVLCMGQVTNAKISELKKFAPRVVATLRTGKKLSRNRLMSYSQADLILVNSFAWQQILQGVGIKAPVEVVGNGLLIEPQEDPAARLLLRRKFGASDNTCVVLCLQRMIPGKGQHYLMENFLCAAQNLPSGVDTQLWLVGIGPFSWPLWLYSRCLQSIQKDAKVFVMPPQFPLSHYYNAADMVATVSHEDSLPNFLIEAHAFGLPAICEDYAGCGEVVSHGLTGFVSPVDDETSYIAYLQRLISSPDQRFFMGQSARTLSFRFSFDRQLEKILSLLTALC